MTIERRNFLKLLTGASAVVLFPGCASVQGKVVHVLQDDLSPRDRDTSSPLTTVVKHSNEVGSMSQRGESTENAVQSEEEKLWNSSEVQRGIELSGKNEMKFFMSYFDIHTYEEYIEKLRVIQIENGLPDDTILGKITLKALYIHYYVLQGQTKVFPLEIQERSRLYAFGRAYANKSRAVWEDGKKRIIYPRGHLDVFDKDLFYGKEGGENIEGTYKNQALDDLLKKASVSPSQETEDGIYIKQYEGKSYLEFIQDGKREVLTYVSPGGYHKDPETDKVRLYPTPENKKYDIIGLSEYHISSSYPKKNNGNHGGAIMGKGVRLTNSGIFLHIGDVDGTALSHGCIRVPGFYQQRIFHLLQKMQDKHLSVNIGKLY